MKALIKQKVLETKKTLVIEEISNFFEKEGFNSVTMQDIAKVIGISVGALYKLFASKEELFYAYIKHQIQSFFKELQSACASVSEPKECLKIYIDLKFSVFASKRKALEDPIIGDPLFFVKMNSQKNNPAKPIFEFLAKLFEKLDKKESLKEKDHMKTAYLFNAFTMGYIEYWLNCGGSLKEESAEVLKSFLDGIKK